MEAHHEGARYFVDGNDGGFLLTGQGVRTFTSLSITEGFLGALTGLLLAATFTLRQRPRQKPQIVADAGLLL
jgi:hypothetical protein